MVLHIVSSGRLVVTLVAPAMVATRVTLYGPGLLGCVRQRTWPSTAWLDTALYYVMKPLK